MKGLRGEELVHGGYLKVKVPCHYVMGELEGWISPLPVYFHLGLSGLRGATLVPARSVAERLNEKGRGRRGGRGCRCDGRKALEANTRKYGGAELPTERPEVESACPSVWEHGLNFLGRGRGRDAGAGATAGKPWKPAHVNTMPQCMGACFKFSGPGQEAQRGYRCGSREALETNTRKYGRGKGRDAGAGATAGKPWKQARARGGAELPKESSEATEGCPRLWARKNEPAIARGGAGAMARKDHVNEGGIRDAYTLAIGSISVSGGGINERSVGKGREGHQSVGKKKTFAPTILRGTHQEANTCKCTARGARGPGSAPGRVYGTSQRAGWLHVISNLFPWLGPFPLFYILGLQLSSERPRSPLALGHPARRLDRCDRRAHPPLARSARIPMTPRKAAAEPPWGATPRMGERFDIAANNIQVIAWKLFQKLSSKAGLESVTDAPVTVSTYPSSVLLSKEDGTKSLAVSLPFGAFPRAGEVNRGSMTSGPLL
ncbi:hypothetical protein FB451DRAFT_1186827 [Mycena latifolia]|nr:hypothetical protein FB451DRAFT_1186827 [Mycena latifolia]